MSKITPNLLAARWDAALHAARFSHPEERPEDSIMARSYDTTEFYAPPKGSTLRWAARQAVMLSGGKTPGQERRTEAMERQVAILTERHDRVQSSATFYVNLYAGQNPFGWQNPRLFVGVCRSHDYRIETDEGSLKINPEGRTAQIAYDDGHQYSIQEHQMTTAQNPTTWTSIGVTLPEGAHQPLYAMPPATAIAHARRLTDTLGEVGDVSQVIKSQLQEAKF